MSITELSVESYIYVYIYILKVTQKCIQNLHFTKKHFLVSYRLKWPEMMARNKGNRLFVRA